MSSLVLDGRISVGRATATTAICGDDSSTKPNNPRTRRRQTTATTTTTTTTTDGLSLGGGQHTLPFLLLAIVWLRMVTRWETLPQEILYQLDSWEVVQPCAFVRIWQSLPFKCRPVLTDLMGSSVTKTRRRHEKAESESWALTCALSHVQRLDHQARIL